MEARDFSRVRLHHVKAMNNNKVNFDFLIAVPEEGGSLRFNPAKALQQEFENPTPIDDKSRSWRLAKMVGERSGYNRTGSCRTRSMTELLFCMLRSKHSYTNYKQEE